MSKLGRGMHVPLRSSANAMVATFSVTYRRQWNDITTSFIESMLNTDPRKGHTR